jgi:hypothetical protein
LVSTPAGASISGASNSNTEFLFNNEGAISPQAVMSYDTNFGAVPRVDFTNQTGWDSPVLFRNAQAAASSFTLFPVNTDGQFEIQQIRPRCPDSVAKPGHRRSCRPEWQSGWWISYGGRWKAHTSCQIGKPRIGANGL